MSNQNKGTLRNQVKNGLARLSNRDIAAFRGCYQPEDLEVPIDLVVDSLSGEALERALSHVEMARKLSKVET